MARASRPRGSSTRAKLLVAARQLFVERGYHNTRPQDVVRAAGVAYGSFYSHFSDKRACFAAFAEEVRREVTDVIARHTRGTRTLRDFLVGVFDASDEYMRTNPGIDSIATADLKLVDPALGALQPQLMDTWAADCAIVLRRLIASGEMRPDLDPLILAYAMVGIISRTARAAIRGEYSQTRLIRNILPFLESGLAPVPQAPKRPAGRRRPGAKPGKRKRASKRGKP